eukprot:6187713-Pleurochrysis_carterae.AAC.2
MFGVEQACSCYFPRSVSALHQHITATMRWRPAGSVAARAQAQACGESHRSGLMLSVRKLLFEIKKRMAINY